MNTKPVGISIIICCYNGAHRLTKTIKHISRQQIPPNIAWELLVVDNASTDNLSHVVEGAWRSEGGDPASLRIVYEPRLGLSHARACGFREARYEYIVMCDDDNWLAPDYAHLIFKIMQEGPTIGAVGGHGTVEYEGSPASVELLRVFAAGPQGPTTGPANNSRVFGAGTGIRYSAWKKLDEYGFKSLLTDRKGQMLTSGGDYELCLALRMIGYEIWYDERLRFVHYISSERLTWSYFLRYAKESTEGFHVITSYTMVASKHPLASWTVLVLMRNLMITLSIWIRTESKRLGNVAEQERIFLRFYALIYRRKLVLYLSGFRRMARAHRKILQFDGRLRTARAERAARRGYANRLRPFFFSKPSRPLR